VENEFVLQGRRLGAAQVQQVRDLLAAHPDWSRYRLSRQLCELWRWQAPNGQWQDMAARSLLLKLEQRGWIRLPARRWPSPNRMVHKRVRAVEHACELITGGLAEVAPLDIQELSQRPEGLPLYEWLLHEYHYLSYASPVGLNLKYLVRDRQGRPLSCLLFGSAAWHCAVRDRFIGWSEAARAQGLQRLTNNTRFVVLPWVRVPQLASHILSRVLVRLPQDWQSKYARSLELVETFVDSSRFTGACYRAANWLDLGPTTGRTRQDRAHRLAVAPKRVLVYPLRPDFRRLLGA
jgi:hypothetical protein